MCALLLTGLLAAGARACPASAQQPDTAEDDTTGLEDIPEGAASAERKSPARAVLYSASGTVLLSFILVGPIVGPAFGHFYAGDNTQAWRGIALRGGGAVLSLGFGIAHLGSMQTGGGSDAAEDGTLLGAKVALWGVFAHAVYDTITAWHSAKEYNESHDVRAQVAPTVGPRGEQVGVTLRVSF
jgi:hypothetical protein